MIKFNKVFNSKIILLVIICIFLLDYTAYGIDLSKKSFLRKPLDFNDPKANSRYSAVLLQSEVLDLKEPLIRTKATEFMINPFLVETMRKRIKVIVSNEAQKNNPQLVTLAELELDKLFEEVKNLPVSTYEQDLFEFFTKGEGKDIPIEFHPEKQGGHGWAARDKDNPKDGPYVVWFGYPERTRHYHDPRSLYQLFFHEASHMMDGINVLKGLAAEIKGYIGITEHIMLFMEFRANLWATKGDLKEAARFTALTYSTAFDRLLESLLINTKFFELQTIDKDLRDLITESDFLSEKLYRLLWVLSNEEQNQLSWDYNKAHQKKIRYYVDMLNEVYKNRYGSNLHGALISQAQEKFTSLAMERKTEKPLDIHAEPEILLVNGLTQYKEKLEEFLEELRTKFGKDNDTDRQHGLLRFDGYERAILPAYYELMKTVHKYLSLKDKGDFIYVYPFSGPDRILSMLGNNTVFINLDKWDSDDGFNILGRAFDSKMINQARSNADPEEKSLDAMDYKTWDNVAKLKNMSKTIIIKGFFSYAGEKYPNASVEPILRYIFNNILQKGDHILILNKNDIEAEKIAKEAGFSVIGPREESFFPYRGVFTDRTKVLLIPSAFILLEKREISVEGIGKFSKSIFSSL